MGMNAIETRGLNLWYGDFQALKDVTLHVEQGGITALIGSSGCGKTTLLRCCNRINERIPKVRTSGEIRILDKNIYDPDVSLLELRKTVGMVFQRPNPLPVSIYENIVFGLRLHAPPEARTRPALDAAVEKALTEAALWADVKDKLHDTATSLQLEQQQKLCIARLLPLQPEIILMDEPCAALDIAGTESIEQLIRGWQGVYTTLIVTHNMAQARRVSDHSAFMLTGQLVEYGTTEEVFDRPKDPRTSDYIAGHYG
ncbi:MAG: phosphate ABC transporter ATP-binding protein [Bryobacteraceae bacterium]|nr:phosphate ABC transporter ATP-binding protein [Bryobacteraceae bacterium]